MNNSEKEPMLIDFILDRIEEIEDFLAQDKTLFFESPLHRNAVLRSLQILCETTQRLSQDVKSELLSIPWKDISDFRNVLVHEYMGLDLPTVMEVIEIHLPILKKELNGIKDKYD